MPLWRLGRGDLRDFARTLSCHQDIAADGAFSLDNIPPGSYTLAMWHEGVAIVRTDREKGIPSKYTFEDPYLETRQITIAPRGNTRADFQLSLR